MCHWCNLVVGGWQANGRLSQYLNILKNCDNIYNVLYHLQKGYVTLFLFLTQILVPNTKFLFYVPLFPIKFLYIFQQTLIILLFTISCLCQLHYLCIMTPLDFVSFAMSIEKVQSSTSSSLLPRIALCHHSSLLLPQTMDYFETHNGYNKDIKYLEQCKFLELGESTPRPLKIVVTNRKKLHLVFLGTCGHHILDNFCSFEVYCIIFKLKLLYFKRKFDQHL